MKKKIVHLSIVLIGLFCLFLSTSYNANAYSDEPITKLDKVKLDRVGITLYKPNIKAKITEEEAKDSAKKAFPEWANAASEIRVEYQLMTNLKFKGFSEISLEKNKSLKEKGHMEKLPVYIITYEGLAIPNSKNVMHSEYHVVVDAETGESLMGLSYK